MIEVRVGETYMHYKGGGPYEVIHIGTHTETDETMVVYRLADGTGDVWVRPLAVFSSTVVTSATSMPRFTRVG